MHDHGVSATLLGNEHVYISDCKDAGNCMLDTHINCSLPSDDKPVTKLLASISWAYLISGSRDGTAEIRDHQSTSALIPMLLNH